MLMIHDLAETQELDHDAMEIIIGGRSLYWFSDSYKSDALGNIDGGDSLVANQDSQERRLKGFPGNLDLINDG